MPFVDNYAKAMAEFEKLTTSRAQVLKNKGKETGLKKLTVLFKSGKTLEQRAAIFDQALKLSGTVNTTPAEAKAAVKKIDEAFTKWNEGLKKNRDEFAKSIPDVAVDPDMKAGYEIFVKRLDQLRRESKLQFDAKIAGMQNIITGKTVTGDAKLAADVRVAYLGIKGGADETEALIKLFVARPTEENAYTLLTNTKGPRSMAVGVTTWKNLVVKRSPGMADRLATAGGGDPEHLLRPVYDITQNKGRPFWQDKLKIGQPGWENRVKAEAATLAKVVGHLRRSADAMKTLV